MLCRDIDIMQRVWSKNKKEGIVCYIFGIELSINFYIYTAEQRRLAQEEKEIEQEQKQLIRRKQSLLRKHPTSHFKRTFPVFTSGRGQYDDSEEETESEEDDGNDTDQQQSDDSDDFENEHYTQNNAGIDIYYYFGVVNIVCIYYIQK